MSNRNNNKTIKTKTVQYTNEMLYRHLEAILKQMLLVWTKECIAIYKISGKKSGNIKQSQIKLSH